MSQQRPRDTEAMPAEKAQRPLHDEGAVIGFGIASVVFLFAVFVVLVLAGLADSPRALAFLAIPLAGLALSGLLFARALRAPYSPARSRR